MEYCRRERCDGYGDGDGDGGNVRADFPSFINTILADSSTSTELYRACACSVCVLLLYRTVTYSTAQRNTILVINSNPGTAFAKASVASHSPVRRGRLFIDA